MKRILGLSLLVFALASPAYGLPTVTFDEAGVGTIFDGTTTTPLPALFAFSDPVSLVPTLAYVLPFTPQAGDVLVTEAATGGTSDLLRFSTVFPGFLFVFSDPAEPGEPGGPADFVIPPLILPFVNVQEVGTEDSNGIAYTPAPIGPGFSPGVTYVFISDSPTGRAPVAEPGTVILLGSGLAVLAAIGRKRLFPTT